jgi:hypothetical protein
VDLAYLLSVGVEIIISSLSDGGGGPEPSKSAMIAHTYVNRV